MCKCLCCYKELEEGQKDFHPSCARKFFGTKDVPLLEYKHEELLALPTCRGLSTDASL